MSRLKYKYQRGEEKKKKKKRIALVIILQVKTNFCLENMCFALSAIFFINLLKKESFTLLL